VQGWAEHPVCIAVPCSIPASLPVSWGAAGAMAVYSKIKSQDMGRWFPSFKQIILILYPVTNTDQQTLHSVSSNKLLTLWEYRVTDRKIL
jgi:Leucine-rich repeat (LRR) protein